MIRSLLAIVAGILAAGSAQGAELEAGAAKADITPPIGFPMWGYAARHDKPSVGVLDTLFARALVLKAGDAKIALVGLDLGRAPTRDSMQRIRDALKKDGFTELFLVASHTHHGPVLELDTWPKPEKPYTCELEEKLIASSRKPTRPACPLPSAWARLKPNSTAIANQREPTSRPMQNCSSCVSRT